MKKNTAYTIGSLIVLLICAFCFVVLPAFTGTSQKQDTLPSFGKYNGKEIKYEQGTDFYDFVSQYGQMFQNYGQQIDSSTYYYIFSYAFNSTVTKMAYTDAVKASGYKVPETAITRGLIPYFSDENGKYSSKLYKQTDAATIASLHSSVEDSLYTSRYNDDLFGSSTDSVGAYNLYGMKEADAELDFLANFGANKRGFNMAVFSMNDYPDEEKVKYGKANAAKFDKYDLSVVTVSDKSLASTIVKRINNNEITFEDAVSEYSDKLYSNTEGKLTTSYQYQIENLLQDKADIAKLAALSTGDLSDVIATNSTYSIFKKNAETAAPDFEAEDMKNTLSSYLKNYEISIIEDYFTAKAKDFTNEAMKSDFKAACEKLSVENVEIAPFPLNYGSVSITQSVDTSLSGLSYADTNENFLNTAFSLKMNEISAPLVMNNSVIVLQYTTNGDTETQEEEATISDISNFDGDSVNTAIMNSDKLENNFANVYFNNLMSN